MPDSPSTTVAVLGTGIMGAGMARNLARAGLPTRVWNRTRAKAEPLAGDGAQVVDTPADAARGADVVVTMLADGDAVEAAIAGADGALAAMDPDAVWAQTSTVGVAATERLAELAAGRGVVFVDAPVLGTREPAEQGALVIFASGPETARERCAPVFEAISSRTVALGEAGAGTRLKVVVNNWLVGLVENLAETIALAEALGVAPESFLETIDGGPIGAPYAQLKGKAMIARDFPPSFTLALARKDVGLVLEAASDAGLELPVARAVAAQFDRGIERGHGDEDMAAVYYASADDRRG